MQLNLAEKFFPEDKFISLSVMDYNALKHKWSTLDLTKYSLLLEINDLLSGTHNLYIVLFFREPNKVEVVLMNGNDQTTFYKNAAVTVTMGENKYV